MELSKGNVRKILFIVLIAALIVIGLYRIGDVVNVIGAIFYLLTPFFFGIAIALLLNIIMNPLERLLSKNIRLRKRITEKGKTKHPARVLSLIISIAIAILIVIVFFALIVPRLYDTFAQLVRTVPYALRDLQLWVNATVDQYPQIEEWVADLDIDLQNIFSNVSTFLRSSMTRLINSTVNAVSSALLALVNIFIGFVFAIYLLLHKDQLANQFNRLMYAFFPQEKAENIIYVAALSGKTFSAFVAGQCIEAVILAMLCFIGMMILKIPFALLISLIAMVFALIPIFGAWFSGIIGFLLILIEAPIKAVIFVLFIIILQQVEGHVIYPKTMSKNIQLPSMWILVAVTIGGKMFGIVGMIVFIPICSVIYTLTREVMHHRLRQKGMLGKTSETKKGLF